jgi:biotin carboxyl carrier protein
MATTLQLRSGDDVVSATLESPSRVAIDGRTYDVTTVDRGEYLVSDGESRWTIVVAGDRDGRWTFAHGAVGQIEITTEGHDGRRRRRLADDELTAPMPATVVKLLIQPGAVVAKGDTLLVLEAMKMELPIRAPRSGVVDRIFCRVGELVQPGVELLELG